MAKKKTENEVVKDVVEAPQEEKVEAVVETEQQAKVETPVVVEEPVVVEPTPEDLFVADPKDKRPKTYAKITQAKSSYSDDQAVNLLRKKIQSYKQVHERFLQKIDEEGAFLLEKLFVPVFTGKAEACYQWKTKLNGEEVEHKELRTVEGVFCDGTKDLALTDFTLVDSTVVTGEKRKEELMDGKKPRPFKKSVKDLAVRIKKETPDKKAKWGVRNEEYALVYIPVLKATCTLDGDAYTGYVNLHNGESFSEYRISEKLGRAVAKAEVKNKLAKQSTLSAFVFTLIFAVLSFVKSLYPDWDFGALTLAEGWVSLALAGLSVIPVLCWGALLGFKKKKVLAKCVKTGKMPSSALATLFSLLGWVVVLGSAVLFFFKVLIA